MLGIHVQGSLTLMEVCVDWYALNQFTYSLVSETLFALTQDFINHVYKQRAWGKGQHAYIHVHVYVQCTSTSKCQQYTAMHCTPNPGYLNLKHIQTTSKYTITHNWKQFEHIDVSKLFMLYTYIHTCKCTLHNCFTLVPCLPCSHGNSLVSSLRHCEWVTVKS
jgi:hypothetical protein